MTSYSDICIVEAARGDGGDGTYRIILPYLFQYETHVKSAWFGHSFIDVLSKQFSSTSRAGHLSSISSGRSYVIRRGRPLVPQDPNLILKDSDVLVVVSHRHEPAIPSFNVSDCILYDDDDYLAVHKPGGLPVHECGRYYFNTLRSILCNSLSISLLPLHRLDVETCGVVVFAKDSSVAAAWKKAEENDIKRNISKVYLARVQDGGDDDVFKSLPTVPVYVGDDGDGDGYVVPDAIQLKGALPQLFENNPENVLEFHVIDLPLISTDKVASVVVQQNNDIKNKPKSCTTLVRHLCKDQYIVLLVTGRFHQIRAHFAHYGTYGDGGGGDEIGHAITNDSTYSSVKWSFPPAPKLEYIQLDWCEKCTKDPSYMLSLDIASNSIGLCAHCYYIPLKRKWVISKIPWK